MSGPTDQRPAPADTAEAAAAAAAAAAESDTGAEAASALAAVRHGDPSGLARLTEMFGRDLTRAAYAMVGDGHAAEDLAHDALIAAWDSAAATTPATPVRAWLLGIVLNLCRGYRRSLGRRTRREQAVAGLRREEAADPSDELDRLDALERAMGSLDGPLREVVILRFQQHLDVAATAAALGVPEGTVKSRTHAALKKLRESLGERGTGREEGRP